MIQQSKKHQQRYMTRRSTVLALGLTAVLAPGSHAFAPHSTIRTTTPSVRGASVFSATRTKIRQWNGLAATIKEEDDVVLAKANGQSAAEPFVRPDEEQTPPELTGFSDALNQALEQGNLRRAVNLVQQLQQSQPQSPLLLTRQQWQGIFDAIEEVTANAEENTENLRQLEEASFPATSIARTEMTDMYHALQTAGQLQLYGAANTQTGDIPAAGSTTVPPSLLEGILKLPMQALTPQPTNSFLWAGAAVAVLQGVLSIALDIPLTTLVLSSLFLITVDRLFLNGATMEGFLRLFSPGVEEKILRHEAGHFLLAYLLGCPVEGIVLSAWAALQDKRFGVRGASAGTSFFDPQLSQQINQRQTVTQSSVNRYSIIVMAGIAAEADFYGRADGGAGDEMSLVTFLSQLNGGNNNNNRWNNDSIRNQARWGALQAVLLLREYQPAYQALVKVLQEGNGRAALGDCIYAIEEAAREHNLKPLQQPLGYIVEENGGNVVSWNPISKSDNFNGDKNGHMPTTNGDDSSLQGVNGQDSKTANQQLDPTQMSTTLQEYREQVEAKLRDVEQKLYELEK